MAMLHTGTEQLNFGEAGLLQGVLEVDVFSHLDLLVKQGGLALPGQAATRVLQAAHNTCRSLQSRAGCRNPCGQASSCRSKVMMTEMSILLLIPNLVLRLQLLQARLRTWDIGTQWWHGLWVYHT